jgi:2-polyprenyl-3-methyl-5-hydroxy-6-metoxy-1,4-benzoquinol methylase
MERRGVNEASGESGPGGSGSRSCPACRADSRTTFGDQSSFRWLRCQRCQTLYVAKTPSTNSLSSFYERYYDDPLEVPSLAVKRLRDVVASFESSRSTGQLIDVGFGAGTLLSIAADRGWDCWGTEMSPPQVKMGRSQGWNVHEGSIVDWRLPPSTFDVVCMVELIEHLPDPDAYLRAVGLLLRPGGVLYCTTPNGNSLSARALRTKWSVVSAPEHLQLLTVRGLRIAAGRHALHPMSTQTTGINPSELRRRGKGNGKARVRSAYELNERVESRPTGRVLKAAVNSALSFTQLGDSLKMRFRKSTES